MSERPVSLGDTGLPGMADGLAGAGQARSLLLIRITNHLILRRNLGRAGAGAVTAAVAARIGERLARAAVSQIAPDTIEVTVALDAAPALAAIEMAAAEIDFHAEILIGAATTVDAETDDLRLLEEAEHALSDARRERRSMVRRLGDGDGASDRIGLAQDLPDAIATGAFFLLYQPKLHLRQQRIASVEALIRWQHPSRGIVLPGDFIPLAERSHHIATLTLWTIGQVIADQRRLRRSGHDLRVFVNMAGALLADAGFVRAACALIDASPDAAIGFEITETSVIRDPTTAIANLKRFVEMGIEVAIDDYGAGLSSLAYLKQLPARELKIDKLFVTQLTSSHRDPLIVRSTIDLAHAMEMEVVAEGVETQTALALLSVMGCDMVQGYLISRPIPLAALIDYLAEDRHLIPRPDPRRMLGLGGKAA